MNKLEISPHSLTGLLWAAPVGCCTLKDLKKSALQTELSDIGGARRRARMTSSPPLQTGTTSSEAQATLPPTESTVSVSERVLVSCRDVKDGERRREQTWEKATVRYDNYSHESGGAEL